MGMILWRCLDGFKALSMQRLWFLVMGVTIIRNTGGSGEYKWISIREIDVP